MQVAAEGDVVGAALLGGERDGEDDRRQGGRAEPEVGALLRSQLAKLPAVDGEHAGHQTGSETGCTPRSVRPPVLGELEEEVLERRVAGAQLEHQGAGLGEREGQLADGRLVGGAEVQAALGRLGDLLDAGLRGADAPRALVVGGPQAVAGPRLAAKLGERALVGDPARADDRDAVAELLDLGEQVARQQNGDALAGEVADEPAHVAHPGRVEPGRRLVEQQQARPAQKRGGDAEPLAHPVRVAADPVAGAVGELDDLEHLVDARFESPPSSAAQSSRFARPLR